MKRHTVLIVEDAEDCAVMLEVALQALPVRILRVSTAEQALVALRGNIVAVISDVQLPGISGIELIALAGDVPVVIVSASVDPGIKDAALAAGAAAFFAKPFSPAGVCGKVQELLKESKNV